MSPSEKFLCSDLTREYGVPLIGTATRGDVWFLLEYNERWGAKAFEESTLPQAVKEHLNVAHPSDVKIRVLFIRQEQSRDREGVHFFVGLTNPEKPRLYEYHIQDYVDLLNINLSELVDGQPGDPAHLRLDPLYLVCANGKRDQCCSIYGPETYQAMTEEAGDAVWQSSHIGGHNQAPITLFFPHGANYGRTTSAEIRQLIHAYQSSKIVLHHYRGRVCFEPPVQAAEHFWREKTGYLGLQDMQIESVHELGANEWRINIRNTRSTKVEQMHLKRRFSDFEIPITCSKKKTAPISYFQHIETN